MWDRPLTDDEYEEDELPRSVTPLDPISLGVGAPGFLTPYVLQECRESFPNGPGVITRDPEKFDRYYFDAPGGPVLVDILWDGTSEQLEHERARKHVAFKEGWCNEHEMRYLALPESMSQVAERVRALLQPGSKENPIVVETTKRPAKRGQVQRPKAAAAA